MSHSNGPHVPIDESLAEQIRAIHKKYPKLGHHGILSALEDDGIRVDSEELERFMTANRIKAEKPWRPWRWRGLPGWLGGNRW